MGAEVEAEARKKHIALVIVLWMMRKRTQVDEFRYLCHSKKWRRKNSIKITFNLYLAFRFAGNVGRCRCRRNSRKYIFHAHHCLDSRRTHINCVSVCVFCMFSIAFPKSWICKQKIFLAMKFVYPHPHTPQCTNAKAKIPFCTQTLSTSWPKPARNILSIWLYSCVYSGC